MGEYLAGLGEKPYRAKQVMQWLYARGVRDFDEMTDISKSLRTQFEEHCTTELPRVSEEHLSKDGTCKWLFELHDGNRIETVYIPEKDRGTLCVSSQIGCALDCSFCATARQGFARNLSVDEIIGQVWLANALLAARPETKDCKVTNVVMMGMGEPLLNFDNVVAAMDLMLEDLAYGLSKRRVTLSTSGVVPALDRLAEVSEVSLAVSLHAPNDELRDQLVPINRKYPIAVLLESCRNYMAAQKDKSRVVTIEYTLIQGVNDQQEQARDLAILLRDVPCKINLIPFNTFDQSDYRRPSGNAVSRFWQVLVDAGYIVTVRTTRGDDIDAACGQLVGQVVDRTRRSERYKAAAETQVIEVG